MISLTFVQFLVVSYILWISTTVIYGIYLHRYLTHQAFYLSTSVINFCKVYLWLVLHYWPKDGFAHWVDAHNYHHAYSDTEKDPHSPYFVGLRGMYGFKLPPAKAVVKTTKLDTFLLHLADKIPGRVVLFLFLVLLFGVYGIFIFCVMALMPIVGPNIIVNYLCHLYGYNNSKSRSEDKSKNLLPWGILAAGEELHGNHHRNPRSPTTAVKWWEFDLIYVVLRVLSVFNLVKFKGK